MAFSYRGDPGLKSRRTTINIAADMPSAAAPQIAICPPTFVGTKVLIVKAHKTAINMLIQKQ